LAAGLRGSRPRRVGDRRPAEGEATVEEAQGAKMMANQIPYLAKKALIRRELMKCATATPMESPTYGDFGPRVGIPARGPWKRILDHIAEEETRQGLPDITFLLINKSTGYPGQIGFTVAKPPSAAQRQKAKAEVQKIIEKYNPGTLNRF
jgi:hypothetical protein